MRGGWVVAEGAVFVEEGDEGAEGVWPGGWRRVRVRAAVEGGEGVLCVGERGGAEGAGGGGEGEEGMGSALRRCGAEEEGEDVEVEVERERFQAGHGDRWSVGDGRWLSLRYRGRYGCGWWWGERSSLCAVWGRTAADVGDVFVPCK